MTDPELAALLALLAGLGARTIAVGGARDEASRGAARVVAEAWRAGGGVVAATVDWPEAAASWLRQARRFTAYAPDAWVVAARPAGWLGMGRRLAASTDWSPARTVATAALADASLATAGVFDGLRGATADGGTWRIRRGLFVELPRI
ncbi:MAG TPA: hypothetical protein VGN37_24940 [Actinocatenispora sp.]